MRGVSRGLWFAVLLLPACGGGGGGPAASLGPPSASVGTPGGSQRSAVPIDFTLSDPDGNSASIVVEFSANGGGTWAAASPAYGNGALTGLAAAPGGTLHTFLWDSVEDDVAVGAFDATSPGTPNANVRIRITPSDVAPGTPGSTASFLVDNTLHRTSGVATAAFPHTLTLMGTGETALGDLVADATRLRYGTQLALQNGWGIRAPLPSAYLPADTSLRRTAPPYAIGPPYDLVLGDFYVMLPFGNRVITRTVTGSQVWAMLEHGLQSYPANFNGFPQISGFTVTYSASAPAGSRVVSVALSGGGAILNNATTYTFATNDFLNLGGDGYAMLNDGQGTTRELLAQVVGDYVRLNGPITPVIAGRHLVLP